MQSCHSSKPPQCRLRNVFGKLPGLFVRTLHRPATGPQCAFQAQSHGTAATPGVGAERSASPDAVSHGCDLCLRLRLVYMRSPLTRQRQTSRDNEPLQGASRRLRKTSTKEAGLRRSGPHSSRGRPRGRRVCSSCRRAADWLTKPLLPYGAPFRTQCRQFCFGLSAVDVGEPLAGTGDWPIAQNALLLRRAVSASPQTAELPVLRPLAQTGSQRVPFDVPQHCQQVVVGLDGKRLEPSLVQMPRAFGVVVSVPPHRVGVRQPPEEIRQLRIGLGPHHKVPVVGHDRIREDRQPLASDRFARNTLERSVVLVLLKQREPRGSAHENTFQQRRHGGGEASRQFINHRPATQ